MSDNRPKWAPGPWRVMDDSRAGNVRWIEQDKEDGIWITTVRCEGSSSFDAAPISKEELIATADLIAVAPELYDALDGFCYAVSLRYGSSGGTDDEAFNLANEQYGGAIAHRYVEARRTLRKARGES